MRFRLLTPMVLKRKPTIPAPVTPLHGLGQGEQVHVARVALAPHSKEMPTCRAQRV